MGIPIVLWPEGGTPSHQGSGTHHDLDVIGVPLCNDGGMALTAEWACGRLHVSVESEPMMVAVCHCDFCQKRTGSVFQV